MKDDKKTQTLLLRLLVFKYQFWRINSRIHFTSPVNIIYCALPICTHLMYCRIIKLVKVKLRNGSSHTRPTLKAHPNQLNRDNNLKYKWHDSAFERYLQRTYGVWTNHVTFIDTNFILFSHTYKCTSHLMILRFISLICNM